MEITSIERTKRNKDRLSVYVDHQYSFTICEEDFIRLNLYEMKEITQEEIQYIRNDLNYNAAKSVALRFMLTKLRCEREVRFKLENQGYDEEIINRVIDDLHSIGYINDKIYTQKYLYDRSRLKPKSKKLLKMELRNKGISEDIIDEVLDDWQIDEDLMAVGLVKRKFGKYDLHDEKVIRKVYSFLMHRGFSYEIINKAIKGALEE